jgi:hypothetical protein
VDGDEKRSGGTAVCDIATGDEAVASGDVAPAAIVRGPDEHESVEDVTAVGESVQAETVSDDAEPNGSVPDEQAFVADDESVIVGESVQAETVSDDSGPDGSDSDGSVSDGSDSDGSDSDGSDSDGSVPDGSDSDGAVSDEPAAVEDATAEPEAVDDAAEDTEPAPDVAAAEVTPPASRARPRRPFLRRGLLALAAAGFVALGVGAFAWVAPSPAGADQRFVETARSQGHDVAAGGQQSLVVSAARKICDRRVIHDTDRERRATALTIDEISAVGAAFGADTRDFTTLALETYCSS